MRRAKILQVLVPVLFNRGEREGGGGDRDSKEIERGIERGEGERGGKERDREERERERERE
jgi:hypothetical protein